MLRLQRCILRSAPFHISFKGVLADYKSAQAMAEAQRTADANQRASILTRIVEGYKEKNVVTSSGVEQALQTALDGERDSFSDDDGADEDAFMREFRDKRMKGGCSSCSHMSGVFI